MPSDGPVARRCAAVVGYGYPRPSAALVCVHAPRWKRNGVLVCMSYFPQNATPHRGRLVSGSGGRRPCAARDLIADVSAHLCSHYALIPHTPDGHTSRGRGCIGRADRERKMHTKQPNVAEPKRRASPESESPPENAHTAHPLSAGEERPRRTPRLKGGDTLRPTRE
jgi:hypothetical protein